MRLLSLALNGLYKGLKDQMFSFENADDHVIEMNWVASFFVPETLLA